jgi:hypothetical protein
MSVRSERHGAGSAPAQIVLILMMQDDTVKHSDILSGPREVFRYVLDEPLRFSSGDLLLLRISIAFISIAFPS